MVEELGDRGEGAEVGLELVFGDDKEDDEFDGLVIEGFEFEAFEGSTKGGDDFLDAIGGGMGDGDAEADACAHGFFALADGVEDGLAIFGGELFLGDEEIDEFFDGAPTFLGDDCGENERDRKEIAERHSGEYSRDEILWIVRRVFGEGKGLARRICSWREERASFFEG